MPNPKLETYKNKATGVVYDYTDADAQSKIPSTASSENKMATASDVASKVDWESYAKTGAVNELENKATSTGIFTVNADKTVTVNGSPVSDTTFDINSAITIDHPVKLVGCPSGGGGSTYALVAKIGTSYLVDDGNGLELEAGTYRIYILVKGGYTASNVVFKPMFTVNHNLTYADYVPYAMTNRELTEKAQIRSVTPAIDGTVLKAIVNNKAVVQYDLITRVCRFAILATVGTFTHNTAAITGMPKCKQLTGFTFITTSNTTDPIMGGMIDANQTSIYLTKLEGASYPENSNYIFSGSYIIADDVVS